MYDKIHYKLKKNKNKNKKEKKMVKIIQRKSLSTWLSAQLSTCLKYLYFSHHTSLTGNGQIIDSTKVTFWKTWKYMSYGNGSGDVEGKMPWSFCAFWVLCLLPRGEAMF